MCLHSELELTNRCRYVATVNVAESGYGKMRLERLYICKICRCEIWLPFTDDEPLPQQPPADGAGG